MNIYCIGRNYSEHAKELNSELPESPVIFLKPDTALLKNNAPFYYPDFSNNIHYEVEIIIKICKKGKFIEEKFAHKYYEQIGIGIDFTARDIQNSLKEKGLPWELAKGFNGSAPISGFINKTSYNITKLSFSLKKNGEVVQEGNTSEMIFGIDYLISYLSRFFTLKTGDLIFTGTPAGVGPVKIGDNLEAFIENKKMLHVEIK